MSKENDWDHMTEASIVDKSIKNVTQKNGDSNKSDGTRKCRWIL